MSEAFKVTFALVLLSALPSAALSQTSAPAQQPPQTATNAPDPTEVICEKQKPTGSRLVTKKICMTRAQWADLQLQDRQEIDRVQVRRSANGE